MSTSFGWSYPPGVSGNEPQIAGYDESEMTLECGKDDVSLQVIPAESLRMLKEMAKVDVEEKPWHVTPHWVQQLRNILGRVEEIVTTCTYEGEVTVFWDTDGTWGSWDCPVCGTEHRIEAPEPDEDAGKDR